jgi:cysteine desulfuration protein SufE
MPSQASPRPAALDKVVQRFQRLNDPKQRYELLIVLAKRLKPMPDEYKVSENKVQGCTSQVFVTATLAEGQLQFLGDSDSQLVKGLVALLIEGLNGLPPEQVLALTPDFIQDTGLNVSLTPSRANGFYNIFQVMRQKAAIYHEATIAAAQQ